MRYLTLNQTELHQLIGAINPGHPFSGRDKALLTLFLHTGLRNAEMVGLDVHNVAFNGQPRQTLQVPDPLAKGGQGRLIPLNARAREAIVAQLRFNEMRGFSVAPTAPLWVNKFHRRLTVRDVQRLVKELREAAGLDVQATPHTLRHVFATEVVRQTGNVRVCQQLLGHKRLSSTQVYTHPTRADLAAAVAKLA